MCRPTDASSLACLLLLASALHVVLCHNSLIGSRAPCQNEGEPVELEGELRSCFRCICKNGFVECRQELCPPIEDCYVVMPRTGCCSRCKGCWYNGTEHASHTEWSEGPQLVRCEAGVVTVSRPECHVPCDHSSRTRHTHYNCPVCNDCVINGQRVSEGREVTDSDDPCLKCRCLRGGLTCAKRACAVLACPPSAQDTPPGECCARCLHPTAAKILPGHGLSKPCVMGKDFHPHLSSFSVDACTDCMCRNGTAVCMRHTCPVVTCGARALSPPPGKCCPRCPEVAEAKSACVISGNTYVDGETWQLDACKSCECHGGEPRCALERCPTLVCAPDQQLRKLPGQCCAKCVDSDGVCTVFGDPHYKTFDGKFFSFQGSCKYQLVADCVNDTFSIRISNDARNTNYSSWTRTATLRVGGVKINLGRKMRVKVDGKRVALPHKMLDVATISRSNGSVLVRAHVGLELLWDGDGFLEVTVSSAYKNKLCGLCGNFNSLARDDLRTRSGRLVNGTRQFGDSWRVGGRRACTRTNERQSRVQCPTKRRRRARQLCQAFEKSVFSSCAAKLNWENYRSACKHDACRCPGGRCHCAAYRAYARECRRLGAEPHGWAAAAWCAGPPAPWLHPRGRAEHNPRSDNNLLLIPANRTQTPKSRHRPPPPILH